MFKSLASIALATAAFVSPVAAGIHDFTPTNVGPVRRPSSSTAGMKGNCYKTTDQSSVCYFTTDGANYNVAIYDVDYPSHPAVFTINCRSGRWRSWGNMPTTQIRMWSNVLCRNIS